MFVSGRDAPLGGCQRAPTQPRHRVQPLSFEVPQRPRNPLLNRKIVERSGIFALKKMPCSGARISYDVLVRPLRRPGHVSKEPPTAQLLPREANGDRGQPPPDGFGLSQMRDTANRFQENLLNGSSVSSSSPRSESPIAATYLA